ncbi:protein kinase domain-containing protein [Brachybacterium sp. UNK5269]|uniref:protein kinase domain-containing protein n=1 Tax=Brachybacterium sp. UNK5269 TaxID=3408576 RepID=UPI003BAF9BA7
MIHRDLKPSNVMLRGATEEDLTGFDPDGDRLDPVIIDFGIAIAAEESRLTSTGLVMGTAAYLDPEVIRTDHTGEAGDWWAWAALLAFAATGRPPFGSGRADLVFLRADRGEIDVEGMPTELADWLRAVLQPVPAQRPTPEQMLERLAALDLTRYDDPGETELLAAGSRTAVLPVAGATAGGAAPAGAAADTAGEPVTEALPAIGAEQPVSAGDGADGPVTEVLPVLSAAGEEQPTQALPRVSTPVEPVTEALPITGTPTRAMPVIPPPHAPVGHDSGWATGSGAPASYPQPMPQRTGQQLPPAQRPVQQHPAQSAPTQQLPVHFPPPPQPPGAQLQAPQQPWPQGHPATAAGPMPPHAAWASPPPALPRRPLLVWIGHLLIVALAGIAPYAALAVMVLLGALARTWERSHQSVAAQRMRGATGSGPLWRAALAVPFRAAQGLLEVVLQMLLPLVLGLLVGIALDAAWTLLQGSPPPDGVPFATAIAITLLITWVGIGSRTTRNGAHRLLDAAAPDRTWSAVVLVLLVLLLGAVVFTLLAREGMVDYFPFPGGPRLDDIALWRR